MAEVFSEFLDTNRIDVTLTSTAVPTMPVRHFERARDLRAEIIDARLWGVKGAKTQIYRAASASRP
jgi:hypothetical protein